MKAVMPKKCDFWLQIHGLPYDCRGQASTRVVGGENRENISGEVELQGVQQRKFICLKLELDVTKALVRGPDCG